MSQRACCETPRFGAIEYAEEEVVTLPCGVMPFAWATRFLLVNQESHWPFTWLQSLDDPRLAFLLAPLDVVFPDRDTQARGQVSGALEGDLPAETRLYGIVVLNADPSLLTINLLAPVLVDTAAGCGRQVILDGPLELTREPLEAALRALAAA